MAISVVVPVYNGALTVGELTKQLSQVLPTLTDHYELIFVEDAAPDNSWAEILQLVKQYPFVRGIQLMRNSGQHNALLCGIRAAHYDIIVTMDDDLQHPPDQIACLLAKLDEGYDVVYGSPTQEQHGFWRDMASHITKVALQNAMGINAASKVSAFRAFRTNLREAFRNYDDPYVVIDVLLTWGTTRFASCPVTHNPRLIGKSNYTFRKLMVHAINMMTGFSIIPLQLASWLGFGFTLFGIGVLIYVLGRYALLGYSMPGFPFLASVISIFSGVQLFVIGIVGEYLARIHTRLMKRPSSTIRTSIGWEK